MKELQGDARQAQARPIELDAGAIELAAAGDLAAVSRQQGRTVTMASVRADRRRCGGAAHASATAWIASSTRIELIAAIFVGIVAADIFITVMLRYFFGIDIPDSYDFGQLLLGILIFWGIAATSYRGTHITVDLVWANVGPRWQRAIDVFATLVLLFVVTRADLHAVRQGASAPTTPTSRPSTCGCRPGRSSRSPGSATSSAVLLIAVRTYRLIFQPELMARGQPADQAGRMRAPAMSTDMPSPSSASSRCSC